MTDAGPTGVVNVLIPVNHRQLWSVLRAVQDSDGDVGNICRPSSDVRGPEDHQARLQSNPQKQENYCGQSRSSGHTGMRLLSTSPCILQCNLTGSQNLQAERNRDLGTTYHARVQS